MAKFIDPETRSRGTCLITLLSVTCAVVACSEPSGVGDSRLPASPSSASVVAAPSHQQGPSRLDTPWRNMGDSELAAKVADAGGRVFIGFKDPAAGSGVDEVGRALASKSAVAAAKARLQESGVVVEFESKELPLVVARVPNGAVTQLRADPLIEYIEPIYAGTFDSQTTTWNVQRVRAPNAWTYSTGSGAKLLIIDSGIDLDHPDLSPAVVQTCLPWDPYEDDGHDEYGHGTAVSGIAAAVNNSIQVVGVSYGVSLWSSKIGAEAPDAGYAACAVEFAKTNDLDVINMSFSLSPYTSLTDELNNAYYQHGIVLVGAAGNTNGGSVQYPATLDAVIAVSATDTVNAFASFSAVGQKVELTAPGTTVEDVRGLTTTCLDGTACATFEGGVLQGTSFSAPHVSAAAAILKAFHPAWTNGDVRKALDSTAVDLGTAGRDSYFGYGLIDVAAAVVYDAPPVSASIVGPSRMRPNDECYYDSNVSGGTPPYTYSWYQGSTLVGTQSWVDVSSSGYVSSFRLFLNVTDAVGGHGGTHIDVSISTGAPVCMN